ncbi:2621_t:CDS:1, partial [Entrophospora sp. SA101]
SCANFLSQEVDENINLTDNEDDDDSVKNKLHKAIVDFSKEN